MKHKVSISNLTTRKEDAMIEGYTPLSEVARQEGIPYQTMYRYWHDGKLPYKRVSHLILVKEDVARDLARNHHKPRRIFTPTPR